MSPPAAIGPYRILRELGRGGLGVVWEGEEPGTGRRVAIKQMLGADAEDLLRFRREGELLARCKHPGLVRVHGIIEEPGAPPALVMERVEGRPLTAADGQRLGARGVARLVASLCLAVEAMHRMGVLHRDLKPANVLLRADDEPVLIDLGLAVARDVPRLTATQALVGSPSWMAPEQARGDPVDECSDVHGLGAVLYFLLTGSEPYGGGPLLGVLQRAARGAIDPASLAPLDPRLGAIVRRALASDPAARFPSAVQLALALRQWASDPTPRGVGGLLPGLVAAGMCLTAVTLLGVWSLAPPERAPVRGEPHPAGSRGAPDLAAAGSSQATSAESEDSEQEPQQPLRTWPAPLKAAFLSRLSWAETTLDETPRTIAWELHLRERLMGEPPGKALVWLRLTNMSFVLDHASLGRMHYPEASPGLLAPLGEVRGRLVRRWSEARTGALLEVLGAHELLGVVAAKTPLRDESTEATVLLAAASLAQRLPDCLELVHHLAPDVADPGESWRVASRDARGAWYERRFERRSPERITFELQQCAPGRYPIPPVLFGWEAAEGGEERVRLSGAVLLGPRGVKQVEATQELRRGAVGRRMTVRWTRLEDVP